MLEKTVDIFNVDLAEDIPMYRDIPKYQKQHFAHVLLYSHS